MSEPIDFTCRVCGKECDVAPDLPERAICEEHCEDHEFEYDAYERTHICKHCGKPVDPGWYADDGDYC